MVFSIVASCFRIALIVAMTSCLATPRAFAKTSQECIRALVEATTREIHEERLAGPEAPTVPRPTRPAPTQPMPHPNPAPQPYEPRRVPVPKKPESPPRRIPVKPLEDPKDILPEDLYVTDKKVVHFWNEMPVGLRRVMIEGARSEKKTLEAYVAAKYGSADVRTVIRETQKLQTEIEVIEVTNKPRILGVIKKMIDDRYGDKVQGLKIGITLEKPLPNTHAHSSTTSVPELPIEFDPGMVYRSEFRNLWQQGEGWIGMQEFAFGMATDLDQISPGLGAKYQDLDKLYRLGQLALLDQIPDARILESIPKDVFSESFSAGREIVTTHFELERDASGNEYVKLASVQGVAVGRNGWAAAHEARKAASQMATPMEGSHRWMMGEARRRALDTATNSATAELRQGVFGPSVVRVLRKRLAILFSDEKVNQIADPDYHHAIDGFFSLEPDAFKHASKLLFDSEFEQNAKIRSEAREFLLRHDVLPNQGGRGE